MSDTETIRSEIKKLSAKAMQAKMDLHDLSEELPIGVDTVMEIAQRVRDSYAALDAKRAELKAMETSA
ncbi:hypothetical protein WSK_1763 [Novosphingobium sp. Rr 2-17]|uniref:CCE_0567 family metalloprotein n=1 Tax=Novosphingobium sp. Rr 2-17 TaxID=555793 RepID=UPI000269A7F2|nr:CCE_0567 family metalloprotein [Novosphingobium sp. Rr 2-17]EIZ79683.1 hypothetical protein WSK_1763 [Novosphingobium sp. Rr 2-17]